MVYLANSEDPDEMQHNVRIQDLVCWSTLLLLMSEGYDEYGLCQTVSQGHSTDCTRAKCYTSVNFVYGFNYLPTFFFFFNVICR